MSTNPIGGSPLDDPTVHGSLSPQSTNPASHASKKDFLIQAAIKTIAHNLDSLPPHSFEATLNPLEHLPVSEIAEVARQNLLPNTQSLREPTTIPLPFDPKNPSGFTNFMKEMIFNLDLVCPPWGSRGLTQIFSEMVIKTTDLPSIEKSCFVSRLLGKLHLSVPEILTLKDIDVHFLKEKGILSEDCEGGTLAMGRVLGVTFGDLFKDPDLTELFNKKVGLRLHEIGQLALFDIAVGNGDRLLRWYDGELLPPQINDGNFMYPTEEGRVGHIIAIDNDIPEGVTGDDDKAFISFIKDHTREVASHILNGMGVSYIIQNIENPAVITEKIQEELEAVEPEYQHEVIKKEAPNQAVRMFNIGRDDKPLSYNDLVTHIEQGLLEGIKKINEADIDLLLNHAETDFQKDLAEKIAERINILKGLG